MRTSRNVAVVVAAGRGSRFGAQLPKQFQPLGGKPIVSFCLELFEESELIDEVVLVVPEDFLAYVSAEIVDKLGMKKVRKITTGGASRQESVLAGLSACPPGIDLVVIHDAVRPFLTRDLLRDVLSRASQTGAAILAVPATESVKLADGEYVSETMERDKVWIAQTPQVFKFDDILNAHRRAQAAMYDKATDDSELYEHYYGRVAIVRGSCNNMKITTRRDYLAAKEILKEIW